MRPMALGFALGRIGQALTMRILQCGALPLARHPPPPLTLNASHLGDW